MKLPHHLVSKPGLKRPNPITKKLVNSNGTQDLRFEKAILKEKLLNQIKSLRDQAIVARNTKEEIRLNQEYERVLTSSCIHDELSDTKTKESTPQKKPDALISNATEAPKIPAIPAKKINTDVNDKALDFHTRLANLMNFKKKYDERQ